MFLIVLLDKDGYAVIVDLGFGMYRYFHSLFLLCTVLSQIHFDDSLQPRV